MSIALDKHDEPSLIVSNSGWQVVDINLDDGNSDCDDDADNDDGGDACGKANIVYV